MIWLRSAIFNAFMFLWTVSTGFIVLMALVMPRDVLWWLATLWVRVGIGTLGLICNIKYEIRGLEHVPEGAVVYASKHQSAWETFIFVLLTPQPAYVLKKELLRIPFFGQAIGNLDMIPIDRASGAKALKLMVQKGRQILNSGRSIVIFPEGTRTTPGDKVRYRKRGITALYAKLPAPVVPVALNSGLFWGRNAFRKHPGTIIIEFLPPIESGLNDEEFINTLKDRIETASEALRLEALAQRSK